MSGRDDATGAGTPQRRDGRAAVPGAAASGAGDGGPGAAPAPAAPEAGATNPAVPGHGMPEPATMDREASNPASPNPASPHPGASRAGADGGATVPEAHAGADGRTMKGTGPGGNAPAGAGMDGAGLGAGLGAGPGAAPKPDTGQGTPENAMPHETPMSTEPHESDPHEGGLADAMPGDATVADAGFAGRVRRAVFWRSGSQILSQIVSWTSTLIVVRLLDPSDYGLFAMTQVVLNFMSFLNGYGLVSALVQAPELEEQRVRQAFGLMLVLNAGLAMAQLVLAGVAADYYGQPVVADLLRVQALIYLSTPFIALPEVLIARSLEFRRSAVVNIASALVAALTALAGALLGWGVWTLVFAPIAGFWVKGAGNMLVTRFWVRPSFDFRGSGPMILFGLSLLGSQLLVMVQSQTDILIGGRVLSPHELGLYSEALFLTQIFVSRFIPPLNDVAFPAYARMQDDRVLLCRAFYRAVRLVMAVACPLYLGMAVVAYPMVDLLFGRKWLAMAPMVAILASTMPFYALQVMFRPALNAIGLPRLNMHISAAGAALMPLAFLVGVRFGATGLAVAFAAGVPVLTAITVAISARPMGVRWGALGRAIRPFLGAALAMVALVWLCDRALPVVMASSVRFATLAAVGAAAYGTLLYLGAPETLRELWAVLRGRPLPEAEGAA